MPEYIAGIEIPEPPHLGTWPIDSVDFGTAERQQPIIDTFRFQSANAKIEQRFLVGTGIKRWTVTLGALNQDEYEDLRDWFESANAAEATFDVPLPTADGNCTSTKVRFADWAIALQHLAGKTKSTGFDLIEIPSTFPSYTIFATSNRFPSGALQTALLAQEQEIIPLIKIIPPGATSVADMILVSDRRVTVGGQLYQPRLLQLGDISQSIDGASDSTSILLANADDVFTQLVDQVNLYRARVEICFFHVPTLTLLQWWAGALVKNPATYEIDFQNGTIQFEPTDGSAELGLAYPVRKLTQLCWKKFNTVHCPYAVEGISGFTTCDKTWENCQERGMDRYHGGIRIDPQIVTTKDNSSGTWGFGRNQLQSSSVIERTVYDQPLREVWTDMDMTVKVTPVAVRDEGDFRNAVGIVARGKVGAYSGNLATHHLNGQQPHDPLKGGGFRYALGSDPAAVGDYFAMGQAPWSGPSAFPGYTYAAGVSFVEVRIVDEKGLQLVTEAATMDATVSYGRGGWYWTAEGAREWRTGITNPTWALVNIWLEAHGLWVDDDHADGITVEQMETILDIPSLIIAANIDDTLVTPLIGDAASERQFCMRGIMQERKPLRDWAEDILRPCLGTWTTRFGKLRITKRTNATPVEAFGEGNVLVGGITGMRGYTPRFTALSVSFADEEWKFAEAPAMQYLDEDYAVRLGRAGLPEYTHADTGGFGLTRKSQAARFATVYAREELGGITEAEQRKHKEFVIHTTILAANVEAGMVVSYQGPETNNEVVNVRILQMTLRGDFSMELLVRTVTASMYQFITGPEAKQAVTAPPPAETFDAAPAGRYCAGTVAPNAADPIYGPSDRFMPVRQEYMQGAGTIEPRLSVDVRLPVTQFVAGARAAEIRSAQLVAAGSLPGERVYYARVAPYNADGEVGPPSPAVILRAPTDYWDIELSNISWPSGTWAGYVLYLGESARGICEQARVAGALPTTITHSAQLLQNTNTLPSKTYVKARVKTKRVVHGGVNGGLVTEVTVPNRLKISDFADTTAPIDDWVGEGLSIPSDRSDGSAPVWNFQITAFDASTGEFTVTPDCVVAGEPENSVQVQDVGIILARVTAAGGDSLTCGKFVNQSAPSGLNVDEEIGLLVRIMSGTGRGQVRRIIANTADTYTLDRPWDVVPDTTSTFIVEEPDWTIGPDAATVNALDSISAIATLKAALPNLLDKLVLVGAFLVDRDSIETDEELCSVRQIYFYGQPPSVRTITADDVVTIFDETVWIDTSGGDVTLTMLSERLRPGRPLTVGSVSDSGVATIAAAAGEDIDGEPSVALSPREVRMFGTQG